MPTCPMRDTSPSVPHSFYLLFLVVCVVFADGYFFTQDIQHCFFAGPIDYLASRQGLLNKILGDRDSWVIVLVECLFIDAVEM